jgi:citrate lyase synthetase
VIEQTQQDVLNIIQQMVSDYGYYAKQCNNTSCDTTYLVKTKNNSIIACVGVKKNIITHLRVKKESRREGVGSLLINMAEDIIKERSYSVASAFVHCNNSPAFSLFAKNYYFPVNRWKHCYCLKKSLR